MWLQLNEMHLEVDYFIIVEGNVTFSGKPRQPVFHIDDPLFSRFRPKLIHSVYCTQAYTPDPRVSDFTVELMARRVPMLDKTLLRKNDMLVSLDSDEIPSLAFLRVLRRCKMQAISLRMFSFSLSLQFSRKKKPHQVRACSGKMARKFKQCRRVPADYMWEPKLRKHELNSPFQPLGTLLGKFGGESYFYKRSLSNTNEQHVELNDTSLTENDFWKVILVPDLRRSSRADLSRLCTVPSHV